MNKPLQGMKLLKKEENKKDENIGKLIRKSRMA